MPLFEYQAERNSMDNWASTKSNADIIAYRLEKNRVSLDGLPTGLPDEEDAAD